MPVKLSRSWTHPKNPKNMPEKKQRAGHLKKSINNQRTKNDFGDSNMLRIAAKRFDTLYNKMIGRH